jgi:capsular polysaccharide biosynthesis protein
MKKINQLDRQSFKETLSDFGTLPKSSISTVYKCTTPPQPFESKPISRFENYLGCTNNHNYNLLKINEGCFLSGTRNIFSIRKMLNFNFPEIDHLHTDQSRWRETYRSQYDKVIPTKLTYLKGKTLLLQGTWSHEYYHFMTETLAKIFIASTLDKLSSFDHFVISGLQKKYVQQWLSILGIDSSKVIDCKDVAVCAQELFVPTYLSPCGETSTELIDFLNAKINYHLKSVKETLKKPRRLFVARRGSRTALFYDYLLKTTLEKLGFESLFAEDYDVLTQAFIFSQADTVVAPHGAGLTNLLFSSAKVLELIGNVYNNTCYVNISGLRNLNYSYHVCPEISRHIIVNPLVVEHLFD